MGLQNATGRDRGTWLDIKAAARYSGLSVWTLYHAVTANQLRHVRVGGRRLIRTTSHWVDEWLRKHEAGPRR